MGWEQIAAILGMGIQDAEERYRQLKPQLDEPVAHVAAPLPTHGAARSGTPARRRTPEWDATAHAQVWDEGNDPGE